MAGNYEIVTPDESAPIVEAATFGITINPKYPTIAIVNRSGIMRDEELPNLVEALSIQVQRDFQPWWGMSANIVGVKHSDPDPPLPYWPIWITEAGQAGKYIAYHTEDAWTPYGVVYRDLAGDNYSISVSHEVLEMLGDPTVNKWALADKRWYPWEACDAVQSLAYWIILDNGAVALSDFVTQLWYDPVYRGVQGAQFDFLRKLSAPLQLAPNGYTLIMDMGGQVSTVWGEQLKNDSFAQVAELPMPGGRRYRRMVGMR